MKGAWRWVGIALTAAAIAYFLFFAIENWDRVPPDSVSGLTLTLIVAMAVLYVGLMVATVYGWQALLKAAGESATFSQAVIIVLISQFGKYLPSNIAHHVGRVVIGRASGLRTTAVIATMVIEAACAIFAALGVGFSALFLAGKFAHDSVDGIMGLPQIGMLVLSAAAAAAAGRLMFKGRVGEKVRRFMEEHQIKSLGARPMLICLALFILNFSFLGGMATVLASTFAISWDNYFWLFTGTYALAWVAGFVVPGAPGGLGVREAVIIALLGPSIGPGSALILTVELRLVSIIGDGLAFALGWLLRRHSVV